MLSTTAKRTTPPDPLIIQLRAPHSTLMVALFSRAVIQQTGPYGEALGKQLESPKVTQARHHNQDIINVS